MLRVVPKSCSPNFTPAAHCFVLSSDFFPVGILATDTTFPGDCGPEAQFCSCLGTKRILLLLGRSGWVGKRLCFSAAEWAIECLWESELRPGIRHKNLVPGRGEHWRRSPQGKRRWNRVKSTGTGGEKTQLLMAMVSGLEGKKAARKPRGRTCVNSCSASGSLGALELSALGLWFPSVRREGWSRFCHSMVRVRNKKEVKQITVKKWRREKQQM